MESSHLAYLGGQEPLDGPRFAYLFEARRINDLEELCQYFWMVRGEPLTDDQKERIFLFWDRCVARSKNLDSPPASLLSLLSLLSCYLKAIDERALRWLLAIAPHTPVNYHADRLIEQLARLADTSPADTGQVLRVLLDAYQPNYDFEGRLKKLIIRLAGDAGAGSDAILSVERARHLPGMIQLYGQLSSPLTNRFKLQRLLPRFPCLTKPRRDELPHGRTAAKSAPNGASAPGLDPDHRRLICSTGGPLCLKSATSGPSTPSPKAMD